MYIDDQSQPCYFKCTFSSSIFFLGEESLSTEQNYFQEPEASKKKNQSQATTGVMMRPKGSEISSQYFSGTSLTLNFQYISLFIAHSMKYSAISVDSKAALLNTLTRSATRCKFDSE